MNIVFMGTPQFSVRILEAVHNKYGVNLVVTQPDKYVGRKKVLTYSPVKEKALELGIEVFQPRSIKQDFKPVLDQNPDIIITAAYGQIIPNEIIDYPRLGCINVHGSLLPKLRGGAPIQRAIERGHTETGITIMYMAQKMDSGDIISQRSIQISDTHTTGTLFEELSVLGKELLMDTLPSIFEQTNQRIPQDLNEVTFGYNLKREEERIDFNLTKEQLDCKLRAFTPGPYLFTTIDDKQIKFITLQKSDIEFDPNIKNGTIIDVTKNSFKVKVENGVVEVLEVQLAGKQRQTVKEFLNGAGRNIIKVNKIFK